MSPKPHRRPSLADLAKAAALPKKEDYGKLPDAELVERARKQDQRAFTEMMERHAPTVGQVIASVTETTPSEDLIQETFIQAFGKLHTLKKPDLFHRWLYRMAHNLAVNYVKQLRGKKFKIEATFDDAPDQEIEVHASLTPPEGWDIKVYHLLIEDLKPEWREAFELRVLYGISYETIADILKVPVGTAKVHVHRAKKELKRRMSGETGKQGEA